MYGHDNACLVVDRCYDPGELVQAYTTCERFLQDHLNWALLECWGKQYGTDTSPRS